jgi:hypothetical protein
MTSGFWNMIGQNLITHAEAYGVGVFAFLLAAGRCMPKPGSPLSLLTLYTWLYNSIQTVLPVHGPPPPTSGTLNGEPIPTPAAAPPQPQK